MSQSLQTFELYVDEGDGKPRFEPLLCESPQEAVSAVRHMISARRLASVQVRFMGSVLFTLQG